MADMLLFNKRIFLFLFYYNFANDIISLTRFDDEDVLYPLRPNWV